MTIRTRLEAFKLWLEGLDYKGLDADVVLYLFLMFVPIVGLIITLAFVAAQLLLSFVAAPLSRRKKVEVENNILTALPLLIVNMLYTGWLFS